MTSSTPTLPHPFLVNGLNHIPPPPVSSFDDLFSFSGLLPPGTSIPSSWGTTRYYDFAPDSPPSSRRVLLIHGGGTCAIGLAPLARLLTEAGNHVVAYDLWGHGLSSTPLETHAPALMHAQILELLSYLGWSKAHVVGFSIGGSTAVTFAATHERVVESVIALAPTGLWRKSRRSWWDVITTDVFNLPGFEWWRRNRLMAFMAGSNPVVKEGWKEMMVKGEVDTVPIQMWEREEHKGHVASLVSLWNYGGVFDEHESFGRLVGKQFKTLIVLGSKDGVIEPEHTKRELEKLGWEGEVPVVEGATHEIVRSHRKEVAALCIEFWDKLEN
ncbi:alpha/beta-hydrolase [Acephala macrosclerotiorum]|nr:alpha/beta-hydrolase [Acephala macrosclerotiorum]